jgi:hypothetical protein
MRTIQRVIALLAAAALSLSCLSTRAGANLSQRNGSYPVELQFVYEATQRIIGLPDGSQALIYVPDRIEGRPPGLCVYLVASSSDRNRDRSFQLEQLIPDEIEKDYPGQIRSVAMSPDHKSLVAVGGWFSSRDKRGHNGIFVLRLDEVHGKVWRLKSWFDVTDRAVGDVAFGPNDLLLAVTRPHDSSDEAPAPLTLYTTAGKNAGSFVRSSVSRPRILENRLLRVDETTYAMFEPDAAQIRFVGLRKHTVEPIRRLPLPFATQPINVVGFDAWPDGRALIARTDASVKKTLVTVIEPSGKAADHEMPHLWRYGYVDPDHVLHGFEVTAGNQMNVTEVAPR